MPQTDYLNYQIPFESGFKITQFFGNNPDYYRQFGLNGHEGLDLIPISNDWSICAIEDGIVLRDIDDPRSGVYGTFVVIWNKENQRAWWYCHLSENYLEYGQEVRKGEAIGMMGKTGNTSGAHLHLNLRYSDENGYPVNVNNGYQGFVDPLPELLDLARNEDSIPENLPRDENKLSEEFIKLQNSEYAHGVWYEAQDVLRFISERMQEIKRLEESLRKKDEEIERLRGLTNTLPSEIRDPVEKPQEEQQVPLLEAFKEPLRYAILLFVSTLITYGLNQLAHLPQTDYTIVILTLALRALDKFVHEYSEKRNMNIKGIIPF